VGPPGSGKTTGLIKLAIVHGLARRRPVRLISIDNYRIAAAAQLQTYAEVLGLPFALVETTTALAHAVEAAPQEALVLIDTPGYAAASVEDSGTELARFLATRQDIDIHLVLTASMRLADLRRAADRFRNFSPGQAVILPPGRNGLFRGNVFRGGAHRKTPLLLLHRAAGAGRSGACH